MFGILLLVNCVSTSSYEKIGFEFFLESGRDGIVSLVYLRGDFGSSVYLRGDFGSSVCLRDRGDTVSEDVDKFDPIKQ